MVLDRLLPRSDFLPRLRMPQTYGIKMANPQDLNSVLTCIRFRIGENLLNTAAQVCDKVEFLQVSPQIVRASCRGIFVAFGGDFSKSCGNALPKHNGYEKLNEMTVGVLELCLLVKSGCRS